MASDHETRGEYEQAIEEGARRAKAHPAVQAATTEYRIRFIEDPDAEFEECNGEARPLTEEEYTANQYLRDGQPIPYAEYLEYYGNPDRHVYLMSEVQKRCPCCGAWGAVTGTGRIDFMDDSPELRSDHERWRTPDEALELPGYLRLMALEDLTEGGWEAPAHAYCQYHATTKTKQIRCQYFHVDPGEGDPRFCAQHQPKGRKAKV